MRRRAPLSSEDRANIALSAALIQSIDATDKRNAPFCVAAMSVGLVILKGGDSFPSLLRSRYAPLLDSALKFLNTPLSDQQLAEMDRTWSMCGCDMLHPLCESLHPTSGNLTKDRNLSRVIISLVALVFAALDQVSPHKLAQKATKGKWPPSAAYLLPTGPQGMVRSMVQWLKYTERTNPWQTYPLFYIAYILRLCPSAEKAVIDAPELVAFFAKRFCAISDALVSNTPLPGPVFPKPDEGLEHLFVFWDAFLDCIPDNDEKPYLRPHARPLFQAIKRVLLALPRVQRIPPDEQAETRSVLQKMEYTVYCAIPEHARPPMDARMVQALRSNVLAMFDKHTLLFTVLSSYEGANTCCGPSCFRPGEDVGAPLRVCQRCRLMLYCSPECQREHWKWAEAPHKASCEDVGRFWAVFRATRDTEEDGEGSERRERFRLAVEQKGYSWDDGIKVLHALDALVGPREQYRRNGMA